MKRIRLTVAYDGTGYCGWQVQPNGITVEEVLNAALSQLTGEEIKVIGASRTDAGVHAEGNVAVFDTKTGIPPERIAYAVNRLLPEDIVVVKSEEVPENWHPRYQDSVKTYEYRILNREMPDPVRRFTTFHVSYPLNPEAMREAAGYLRGEHDFKSFCSIHTDVKSTVRTIYDITIERDGEMLQFTFVGNGFLHKMVRILVGTLLEIGAGTKELAIIDELFATKVREGAGETAPAQGLFLDEVYYK